MGRASSAFFFGIPQGFVVKLTMKTIAGLDLEKITDWDPTTREKFKGPI